MRGRGGWRRGECERERRMAEGRECERERRMAEGRV